MLYWNNDSTRLPAKLHGDLLDLYETNALTHPDTLDVFGTPIDLSKVTNDAYIIAGITDHITDKRREFWGVRFCAPHGGVAKGMCIRLEGQPVAILKMLLERPGELVTREELQNKLWASDRFVDFDNSLNAAIKRLRAALNDSADQPRYIETLSRRGYRFIASVNPAGAEMDVAAPADVPASTAVHTERAGGGRSIG